MIRAWSAAGGCLVMLLAGCGLDQSQRPLSLSADTRSLVLVFYQQAALVAVAQEILAGVPSIPQVVADEDSPVAALEYPLPLSRLAVEPGALDLVPDGDPLPAPRSAWTLASVAGSGGWEPSAGMPEIASRVRFTSCCQRQTGPLRFSCSHQCPPVVRPAPPEELRPGAPPLPPRLSARLCAPTWEQQRLGSLVWCAAPPAIVCGPGQRQGVDAPTCAAVRSCAELQPIPADALWVAPGGTGDGSFAQPFGSVAAALQASGPARTIAIVGEGRLAPFRVAQGATIRGACDGRITFSADALGASVHIATREPVTLVGLRMEGSVEALSGADLKLAGATLAALRIEPDATVHAQEADVLGSAVVAGTFSGEDLTLTSSSAAPLLTLAGPARMALSRVRIAQSGGGSLLYASGASHTTLEHAWMETRGSGLELQAGAELEMLAVGGVGLTLHARDGARVKVQEAYLGLGAAGVALEAAMLSLDDAVVTQVRSEAEATLVVRSSTLSGSRVQAAVLLRPFLAATTSSVSLADLRVDPSDAARSGGLTALGGSLRIERFALGEVACREGAQLTLQDGALSGASERLLNLVDCRLSAAAMSVGGALEARSTSGGATLTLTDVDFLSERPSTTVVLIDGVTASITRARIRGEFAYAIVVRNNARVQATDLRLTAPPLAQGLIVASGAAFDGVRLSFEGGRTAIEAMKSRLAVKDLEVFGAQTGLRANPSPYLLRAERLFAHDNAMAGLSVAGQESEVALSDVELRGNGVGLELAGDLLLVGVLDAALLTGNEVEVKVCSEWPCLR